MYRDEKLHIIGSDNTEYAYTIYDDVSDIGDYPQNVPVECQMPDGTTGYIRGIPSILHSEPGTFVDYPMELPESVVTGVPSLLPSINLNTIHSEFLWLDPSEPVNPLTINWHWTGSSDKYSATSYINPDSATLKYALTIDIEIVAFWNWTDGSQSIAVVGTIPAGATSIEMSGSYGGPTWQSSGGTVVTTFGFKVRTIVTYRQISGRCIWAGSGTVLGATISIAEPLPVGRIQYSGELIPPGIPITWGPYDAITAGGISADPTMTFAPGLIPPITIGGRLIYYPETEGAYGSQVHASFSAAIGIAYASDISFTLDVPTGPSTVISEFYASGTNYTVNMPDEYWK